MSSHLHMRRLSFAKLLWVAGVVVFCSLLGGIWIDSGVYGGSVSAQDGDDGPIRFLDVSLVSNFPESIDFNASIESDVEIEDVRVRLKAGPSSTEQYAYLDLVEGDGGIMNGQLEWRVNTSDRYMPPGTFVEFWFEVFDKEGNEHLSDLYEGLVTDARYEWEEVRTGPIRVFYHGPVHTRAQRLADAAMESMLLMASITGSEIETPIVVTLYNNNAEMLGAVQARSATISRELITEGQAFHDESVVLVLSGNRDIGTLTHELTHILVGRAAGGTSALVPLWLNEGLAEYGNLDPGLSYDYFLEWAVDTDRLAPFTRLRSFPGDPDLVLVSYGQSKSMVNYMIEEYGGDKIAEVLAIISDGMNADIAVRDVYGKTIQELDNEWRSVIGADEYVPPTATATPDVSVAPTPAFGLLTLTPISGGVTVGESGEDDVTPTAEPSPSPEPTATPVVESQDEVVVSPTPLAASSPTSVASDEAIETSSDEDSGGGGSCNSAGDGSPMEASVLGLVLVALGARAAMGVSARRRG